MNILIIIADQLSKIAMGAFGNRYVQTPNIDRLAENGVCFSGCYTPCPLCQPARASFWTGRFPHETGVLSNGLKDPVPQVPVTMPTLGELFTEAGYDAVHFGKTHDAGSLRGFRVFPEKQYPVDTVELWPVNSDTCCDRYTTEHVIAYLCDLPESPFLAVADLNNPHNICQYVGEFAGPHEDLPDSENLPPLPENFCVSNFDALPLPVQYICCSHNRQAQAAGWKEIDYRYYLAAYYHYVSRVDTEIGRILDALNQSTAGQDTLVLFFSDHGDSMGGRGLVTKQVSFYDETTNVPLIINGPGISAHTEDGLCSLLDVLPTLLDIAGIQAVPGLWGKSLWPWVLGERTDSPHDYVVSEWFTEWGFTVEPGRMLRTADWKYTRYREGDGEEFYDMINDSGETISIIHHPAITWHRQLLDKHINETSDNFMSLQPAVDSRWRSHLPGYHNHHGVAAPMVP